MSLEKCLNSTIKKLGLGEWNAIWEPDPTQSNRGRALPEAKTIIVHDEKPEDAMKTLLHEVLEVKLRPILRPYRTLVNALIEWADGQVYAAKEKAIEDLIPILLKFAETEYPIQRVFEEAKTG